MIKTVATISIALFLSACASVQPTAGTVHQCKHHCEQSQCKHGEQCSCESCKHADMTGKTCAKHAPMSTPDKP